MSRKSTQSFLEEAVGLLAHHFGIDRLQAALTKVSNRTVETSEAKASCASSKPDHKANPSITSTLEQIRQKDEEKYRLLTGLYTDLKDRKVLPESQDIRHFAQLIGLKEIRGKSRDDLVPALMRFLLEQPTERLQVDIKRAATVSEQQRQQGFSVLTDKLLSSK